MHVLDFALSTLAPQLPSTPPSTHEHTHTLTHAWVCVEGIVPIHNAHAHIVGGAGFVLPIGWKRVAVVAAAGVVLVAFLSAMFSGGAESREPPRPGVGKPPAWWMEAMDASKTRRRWGAVSSTHYLATEAGFAALKTGGNAVDAAVAMQFMLNVVQPQSTGIGGGCFVVIYNASTGEVSTLDGREEAPKKFHENAFCADEECASGPCECRDGILGNLDDRLASGYSVGVPGTPAAVDRMLRERGTFSLKQAVSFAVSTAKEGFPMYEHLHSRIAQASVRLRYFDASVKLFLKVAHTQRRHLL